MTVTQTEQSLRESGLRVTAPRAAVLDVLGRRPHADTASVVDDVRDTLPNVSRQAVYDCLNTFVDVGLVRRIQPGNSPARYEVRRNDNHHHLVCHSCGEIVDVECAVGEAPCLHVADQHGFTIDEAEVIYWGTCPRCSPSTAAPTKGQP